MILISSVRLENGSCKMRCVPLPALQHPPTRAPGLSFECKLHFIKCRLNIIMHSVLSDLVAFLMRPCSIKWSVIKSRLVRFNFSYFNRASEQFCTND